VVHLVGNGIELFLGVDGQIGSFGEVLPQQSVGVLAGASLPGAMRVAEVDVDAGVGREFWVASHLLALVVGQGLAQDRFSDAAELGGEGGQC